MWRKWETQARVLCNFIWLCLVASCLLLCLHCCSCYTSHIRSVCAKAFCLFSHWVTRCLPLHYLHLLRTSMIFTAGIPSGHLWHSRCCHQQATRLCLTQSYKSFQNEHKQEKMNWRTGWVKGKMCKADEFWFICGQNHGSFPVA